MHRVLTALLVATMVAMPTITWNESANAQIQIAQTPTMDGIGKFTVHMSEKTFLAAHRLLRKVSRDGRTDLSAGLYELQGGTDTSSGQTVFYGNYDPATKNYFLKGYTVAGMTFDIEFLFYQGKLIYLTVDDSSELQEAFVEKYGDGILDFEEEEESCYDKDLGEESTVTVKAGSRTWVNGDIKAISSISQYTHKTCEIHFLVYLSIYDTNLYRAYLVRNKAIKDQKASEAQNTRSRELDEL